ncbi:hypothetical protein [Bacillus thuringiensis]|uniref:Tetratricopeptide repeat protein n=1 Tax=Bacillus thuringiensis TaxID=1428 RepID=A0AAW9JND7_BACTU|nr:hypothetical protein [Bacillus thuringiensis]MDZ5480074.1 hypothetical protein [Bacillus thuringiensis]
MKLVQTNSKNQLFNQLDIWYSIIRKQHVKEATEYYHSIDSSIFKEDKTLYTLYLLFHFRYTILLEEYEYDLELQASDFSNDHKLNYYYNFFKFVHRMNTGDYEQAQCYFDTTKKMLPFIEDECEVAEFNYRSSLYYYYLDDPILSIYHVNNCISYFSQSTDYTIKVAACENTLGMSYTTLEKWQLAEKFLLSSIDTFQTCNEQQLVLKVKYNLGLLYSEQNRPDSAIEYLLNSFENEKDYKTMYLLAREYYKTNSNSQALEYLQKGMQYANEEYRHHYNILIAFIENIPVEKLEIIITKAIEYLEQHKLWREIQLYSEELAIRYLNENNPEKSNEFFYKSYAIKKMFT